MKKKLGVFVLLSSTVLISACGNGGSSGEGSSDETIEFLVSGDDVEGNAMSNMAEKYNEEMDANVEVVEVPYEDMDTRVTNMVRDGDPPELIRTAGFSPLWNDQLLDLGEIGNERNVDESLFIETDNEVKALPLDLTAVGMYINKDLFDEAGVEYPTSEEDVWTWEEFTSSVNEVTENTEGEYGFVMDQSEHRLLTMLYQFGSQGITPNDNGEYEVNQETIEGLEYFVDLNNDGTMPKNVWTSGENATSMFKSGRVAAYMSGNWQLQDFSENVNNFEWQSVYMPQEETRATNLGGNYITAFDGTGNEEATQDFISWLYEKENHEEMANYGGYLPVVEDAEVDYEFANESFEIYQNEIDASADVSSYMKREIDTKQLTAEGNAQDVLREEVIGVLNNDQSIEDAIETTTETYTEVYGNN
ncbi:ABC transporter substrate-binding protein [Marinococcus halophilus]|uniref:Sugar ABC transporter substrate-binding protein n=1 Tax=Marinococcus halophilus TaxID=1371 RepID=A0A510Y997_MARHA|nr:sugar ABC transporter substrate-binding protein [Marinococcus halophilus]OZT79080.1 ABC transporter substrate-binding protein [Marinococcus halophilus]GEK59935.1 sugar ABC transporter substrate-binding protein [Marinococcus halophilus]